MFFMLFNEFYQFRESGDMDICISCSTFRQAPKIQPLLGPHSKSIRELFNQVIDLKDFLFCSIEDESQKITEPGKTAGNQGDETTYDQASATAWALLLILISHSYLVVVNQFAT